MSWGIAETASEIEKIKSESTDYLNGLNSCGVIDWNTYNYAFDFYADLLMKAYKQGRKDAQPEPCDDAVSRKAVEEMLQNGFPARGMWEIEGDVVKQTVCETLADALMDLERLPSVTPKRKTGRWLIREGIPDAQCSECKMYFSDVYDVENSDAFCRHCGAKMEGLKVVKRG